MKNYLSATLLPLNEKMDYLDSNDLRLLDEMANHLLITHEFLQNHHSCSRELNLTPGTRPDNTGLSEQYLGNHH